MVLISSVYARLWNKYPRNKAIKHFKNNRVIHCYCVITQLFFR